MRQPRSIPSSTQSTHCRRASRSICLTLCKRHPSSPALPPPPPFLESTLSSPQLNPLLNTAGARQREGGRRNFLNEGRGREKKTAATSFSSPSHPSIYGHFSRTKVGLTAASLRLSPSLFFNPLSVPDYLGRERPPKHSSSSSPSSCRLDQMMIRRFFSRLLLLSYLEKPAAADENILQCQQNSPPPQLFLMC